MAQTDPKRRHFLYRQMLAVFKLRYICQYTIHFTLSYVENDVKWGPDVFVHIQKLYRCERFGICEWNAGNLEQQKECLEIHNNV